MASLIRQESASPLYGRKASDPEFTYAPRGTASIPLSRADIGKIRHAFNLEEIVYHIVTFLRDDSAALMACSRVSRSFRFTCQRIIFSDLRLDTRRARRFVDILLMSPHLRNFIRHLDISLDASTEHDWEKMVRALASSSECLPRLVALDITGGHYIVVAGGHRKLLPIAVSSLTNICSLHSLERLSIHCAPAVLFSGFPSRSGQCLSRLASLTISVKEREATAGFINRILAQAPRLREFRYTAMDSRLELDSRFTLDLQHNTMLVSLTIETPRLLCFSAAQLDFVARCLRSNRSGCLEVIELSFTGQRETGALVLLDQVLGDSDLLPSLRSVIIRWDLAEYDQREWVLNREREWVIDTRPALRRFSLTRSRGVKVAVNMLGMN
ncbi:hypothetical protein FISHEDRAFT_68483 [Fistulina hepatica ATCC 64428]|uniref:F-box domain-containing protein n=1 Tax=Fistulina hepatica ATCC 64428 TaxID=1128425 RepID=A0A0D7AQ99_9AGAR|nr:hypothetical protein FISHEDRAFT_68483 [Fistulina hepatica ATCC 64428]